MEICEANLGSRPKAGIPPAPVFALKPMPGVAARGMRTAVDAQQMQLGFDTDLFVAAKRIPPATVYSLIRIRKKYMRFADFYWDIRLSGNQGIVLCHSSIDGLHILFKVVTPSPPEVGRGVY